MHIPDTIRFASEADLLSLWGGLFLLLAATCSVMERRRMRRAQINRIGWVPWIGLLLTFGVIGFGLLVISLPVVLTD
ncbi:hypothetical protein [Erythrobacter mangrovi]|uniref:Uncharacterized protein n=1 Tax=Erythrobacter mangrovi TaxID=2739433 RepID=A0A7D4CKN9_9SPHN|nr:hypothetical protein [Erythrobacter mangrovi]QKG70008.1 hypothetical protein HQR01_00715 [Erythrobacter mangrovi]